MRADAEGYLPDLSADEASAERFFAAKIPRCCIHSAVHRPRRLIFAGALRRVLIVRSDMKFCAASRIRIARLTDLFCVIRRIRIDCLTELVFVLRHIRIGRRGARFFAEMLQTDPDNPVPAAPAALLYLKNDRYSCCVFLSVSRPFVTLSLYYIISFSG